jgi:hypothetical protein
MASARFPTRQTNEARTEQAKELVQFFQTHGAVFAYNPKVVHDGPTRNDFRMWFEFIVKMVSRNYDLPDSNQGMNEEVSPFLLSTFINLLCLGAGTAELFELPKSIQEQHNAWFEHTASMAYFLDYVGLVAQACFGMDVFECICNNSIFLDLS